MSRLLTLGDILVSKRENFQLGHEVINKGDVFLVLSKNDFAYTLSSPAGKVSFWYYDAVGNIKDYFRIVSVKHS